MRIKVFDATVLINILSEIEFPEIFVEWVKSGKYQLMVPYRVCMEIKHPKIKGGFHKMIKSGIFTILDEVPEDKVKKIKQNYPKLTFADCEVLYYGKQYEKSICLTDETPLTNYLRKKQLMRGGTRGIYNKICKDQQFPRNEIDRKFHKIISDKKTAKYK